MSPESLILELPPHQREIAKVLRGIVISFSIGVEERVAYGLPFFYYYGPLCYLNPKKEGVDVGFTRGQQLLPSCPYLEVAKRKKMANMFINEISNQKLELFQSALVQAMQLNKEVFLQKRIKK